MRIDSVATWVALDQFNGVPKPLIDWHKSLGLGAFFPKIANGLTKWVGLEPHFKAAGEAGLEKWAWVYCWGHVGEGVGFGQHAKALGVTLLVLDVEREWESKAGLWQSSREATARRLINEIRSGGGYTGDLALCSWWHAKGNTKVPYRVFLDECKFNMPQMYHIGRYDTAGAAALVSDSLQMYAEVANWPPEKTIPVLAAFGQSFGNPLRWWKTTIPQMQATFERAKEHGCQSVTYYSTDYLMGRAGHEAPKVYEGAMVDALKALQPSGQPPAPPPPPDDQPIPIRLEVPAGRAEVEVVEV